jgi:hypothetical protein
VDEVEADLGDVSPAAVDRERMAAAFDFEELGATGFIPCLL